MKAKLKAYLIWHKYDWQDVPDYWLCNTDMSGCGPEYVPVSEHEFEVEIPDDFDPRQKQIKALREVKEQLLAEARVKATNIDEQISRLLAIEHKKAPEEA